MTQVLEIVTCILPGNASTLQNSISILKTSISALEFSIATLEGSSPNWEAFSWVCSFAVAAGVAAEIVGMVWTYREEKEVWKRGIVRPPDRPSVHKFWFEMVATVLVVAGVFGEAWSSAALASINSQLRSRTSELRAKSDQLLALVTQEAGSAADSAKVAEGASEGAVLKANTAKVNSDDAIAESNEAREMIGGLEKQANAFIYLIGARRVKDVEGLRNELEKTLVGRSIAFDSYVGYPEAYWLCSQLVEIAQAAHIDARNECATKQPSSLPIVGLDVRAPSTDEAQQIAAILSRTGRVKGHFDQLHVSPDLRITVGLQEFWPLDPSVLKRRAPNTKR